MRLCVLSHFSHVQLFTTPWTIAHQAPLSMEFSRQEYWMDCHFLLQRIFPTQGLNPHLLRLLHRQVNSLPLCRLGRNSMVRHRNRNIDERNTIESPEIYSCTYSQFICDEGSKATQRRRDDLPKKGEPESESHGEQTGFAESDGKSPHFGIPRPIILTQDLLPRTAALTTFLLVLTLFMNTLSPTHSCISSLNFYPHKMPCLFNSCWGGIKYTHQK